MAQSKAHMEATDRWRKKAMERIAFDVRRDAEINADYIRAHAVSMGDSVNGFLKRAVAETIERDKQRMTKKNQEPTD